MNKRIFNSHTALTWALGIGGWLVSWAYFARWLMEHQWRFFDAWVEAFTTSDFSTGLHVDLVVVSLMMIALALKDRKTLGPTWTFGVIASLGVSVSMSLALYVVGKLRHQPLGEGHRPAAS